MALTLCIESTTKNCSAALARNGSVVALREDRSDKYTHAEKLQVFIDEVLRSAGAGYGDLEAVAVSKGPGSYTGLRIGVSAAKGIAFGADIPMIAVCPLRAMAAQVADGDSDTLLIPMIDARRMEVFCAGYDGQGALVFDTRAEIVDENSFVDSRPFRKICFFGDGAEKCVPLFADRPEFFFLDGIEASAVGMAALAEEAFKAGHFVDTAYFEPFYLKDFIPGKPKKSQS